MPSRSKLSVRNSMAGAEGSGAGRSHAAGIIARSAMAAAQKVKDCLLLDKADFLSFGRTIVHPKVCARRGASPLARDPRATPHAGSSPSHAASSLQFLRVEIGLMFDSAGLLRGATTAPRARCTVANIMLHPGRLFDRREFLRAVAAGAALAAAGCKSNPEPLGP